MRIGTRQLETLIVMGSPAVLALGNCHRNMIARGLLADEGGTCRITAKGLRALADEMEAGRVGEAIERMKQAAKAART